MTKFNTFRPENSDIWLMIFRNAYYKKKSVLIEISVQFVPKESVNKSALINGLLPLQAQTFV